MTARVLRLILLLLTVSPVYPAITDELEIMRVPEGGIQPQAIVDDQGALHLIYYRGERENGNLYYATRRPGDPDWSTPLQVNSQTGSANRNEAISRSQMAIDKNGVVHVVWFNMVPARYWYARKEQGDAKFEEQRNLVSQYNVGVETGATVAVDGKGGVFILWHAGDFATEDLRAVYMRRSPDGGKTFGEEQRINPDDTGACACCGLKSLVDDQGDIYVSYRAATDKVNRDMILLKSTDGGQSFSSATVHKWMLFACPVSTTSVTDGPGGPVVAWETKGQVFFANVDELEEVKSAPGEAAERRKNPAMAINKAGNILFAWAEGSGWTSGGQLLWQIFDAGGNATESKGQLEETLPDFSSPEVVATKDGNFVIIY